jgi:plastocyanin
MRFIPSILVLALLATGCTKAPESTENQPPAASTHDSGTPSSTPDAGPAREPVPATATMEGDHQVVRVVVSDMGYAPASIELKAGVPARIVFKQESDSQCASQVMINDFNVPATDLPIGKETVVEFTPSESGTFSFTCGMDMMKGKIVVTS